MSTLLDQYISRLSNLTSFNIHSVDETSDTVNPWYEVTGKNVVNDLVIFEATLQEQVQAISAQVMHWGRLSAQCRRVLAVVERQYRHWREILSASLYVKPADWDEEADGVWKRPTGAQVEAAYRSHPDYTLWQKRIERAEEAYNAAEAVLDGFRCKRDMLKSAVYRRREESAPRLSV